MSAAFASAFNSADWARLAGLWHDLGKYRKGFQDYIRRSHDPDAHIESRVVGRDKTHSTAGALHALAQLGPLQGRVLAFLIAGHHAGLPDWEPSDGAGASLKARLATGNADSQREYAEAIAQAIPTDILAGERPTFIGDAGKAGLALWMRMLFSCLVDADFLDTEKFFSPEKSARRGGYPSLTDLKVAFDAYMDAKASDAAAKASPINRHRSDVLAQCRAKAMLAPGFFTLTVPTGGGKTLSSLAFALEHALAHGKHRIVYAIPYTSIIEQTAAVFRGVFETFDDDVVVEHHSNLDVDERKEDHANRLAAENWDAPLIVTTNVQLFESLHAARTSRCRKLHNLAGSVIVLDEAQMLPRDFLAPVLQSLKLLVAHYGVTVVLCTATQPMLRSRHEPVTKRKLLDGIDDARDIVDTPDALFDALKRVEVHLPTDFRVATPWKSLAEELTQHDCVLTILNTRKHARDLFQLMPREGSEHLSALMCAEHRTAVITRIKARLSAKRIGVDTQPLRVNSTQLVETGVDLDFPVVYRALAGMDSIAQAAGRCNREGLLPQPGQVHVFVPQTSGPPGQMRQGEQTTRELAAAGRLIDPLAPATFRDYFDRFYGMDANGKFDREDILELLKPERAAFRSAAARFRLIDEDGESVIVPYGPGAGPNDASPVHGWLGALTKDGNATWVRRKLQRYTVSVTRRQFDRMLVQGDVEEHAGLWLALNVRYDLTFGLLLPDDQGKADDYVI